MVADLKTIHDNRTGNTMADTPNETAAAIQRARALLAAAADPVADVRGSEAYRRRIIPGLLARALAPTRLAAAG